MKLSILTLALLILPAHAADTSKSSVFVKSTCEGKLGSAAVASVKQQVDGSPKYHLVPNLSDEGRFGVVWTINIVCTERPDVAAIATSYGQAKCFPGAYCHQAVDGASLKSALCEAANPADCGHTLFKTFDDYASTPNGAHLQLQ